MALWAGRGDGTAGVSASTSDWARGVHLSVRSDAWAEMDALGHQWVGEEHVLLARNG